MLLGQLLFSCSQVPSSLHSRCDSRCILCFCPEWTCRYLHSMSLRPDYIQWRSVLPPPANNEPSHQTQRHPPHQPPRQVPDNPLLHRQVRVPNRWSDGCSRDGDDSAAASPVREQVQWSNCYLRLTIRLAAQSSRQTNRRGAQPPTFSSRGSSQRRYDVHSHLAR